MASRDDNEQSLLTLVGQALKSWLTGVRNAVMLPYRRYRLQPDPTAVYSTQGAWNGHVDTILTRLGQIAMDAWADVDGAMPPVSRHAFVMTELAKVRNLLVRVPDEVADLIFAEIADAVNGGADVDQIAGRVDQTLDWTGSERWTGRARNIAVTENTRAYGYGTLAAGYELQRFSTTNLRKQWITEADPRVRPQHQAAQGATVALQMPFYVGGEPLMYPADPTGEADNVIHCRCDLRIVR